MMLALTVRQPWAWAIARRGKDYENRSWSPAGRLPLGDTFAIHAGRPDVDFDDSLAIVERVSGQPTTPQDRDEARAHGTLVAFARYGGCVQVQGDLAGSGWTIRTGLRHRMPTDCWLTGPVGWALCDVVALPTSVVLACRGQQGLWRLSSELAAAAREFLAEQAQVDRGDDPIDDA